MKRGLDDVLFDWLVGVMVACFCSLILLTTLKVWIWALR